MPALDVESATMPNLKEMVIKFNRAVDADTIVAANFSNCAVNPVLADDDMTVTVNLTTAATNGEEATVTINNVEDTDGSKIADDTAAKDTYIDGMRPTVEKVVLVGPNEFEITFSEPVTGVANWSVKLNNGSISVTDDVTDEGKRVVSVTINKDLDDGVYTVSISGFEDYAGLDLLATDETLVYATDTSLPEVVKVEATSQEEIVVTFNKAVTLPGTNEDYFNHSGLTANTPDAGGVTVDGATITIEFTDNPLAEGTRKVLIKASTDEDDSTIVDEWGNEMAADVTKEVEVVADNTAPSATSVNDPEDEAEIVINISEDVTTASAEDADNVVVTDSDGDDVALSDDDLTYSAGDDTITVNFDNDLEEGVYTVSINGLVDLSLAENKQTVANEFTFEITDLTEIDPTAIVVELVAGGAGEDEILYVTFPDAMAITGQNSVLEATNYLLDIDGGDDGAGAAALSGDAELSIFDDANKVVKIVIPDIAGIDEDSDLVVGRFADSSDNTYTALQTVLDMTNAAAPAVASIAQTGSATFEVTFNAALTSVDTDSFEITVGGDVYEVASISDALNDDGNTVATIEMKAMLL
jgi:methionine-rich copper-binding protein CopC